MKKSLKLVSITIIFIIILIINSSKVQAALQSNGSTPASKNIEQWLSAVRNMQALGGTLGRTDTINTHDLTSNATDLDIHMEKNTEYGAMAILSASSYGNPNKIGDGQTTTGNETGIVMKTNTEYVSAGTLTKSSIYVNAKPRYKNIYTTSYVAKNGDAITETLGWHGSQSLSWLCCNVHCGLARNNAGSIFSYTRIDNRTGAVGGGLRDEWWTYPSRAAVVVGENL